MQQGHWLIEMKSREAQVAGGAARRVVGVEAKVWSSRAGCVAVAVRVGSWLSRSVEHRPGSSTVPSQKSVAPAGRPVAVGAVPMAQQSKVHRFAAFGAFVDYALHNHSLQRTACGAR